MRLILAFFALQCTSAPPFLIFRSSWRISKSYSRCCSCGLFCFTAYSFHRNFLKLGIYMYKYPAQTVTISDFENSS